MAHEVFNAPGEFTKQLRLTALKRDSVKSGYEVKYQVDTITFQCVKQTNL